MNKRLAQLLFIGIAAFIMWGCEGGGTAPNPPHEINNDDSIAPVIEIYTPTANQVFTSGSVISITGKLTDNAGLYRGTVKIVNDATGAILKDQLYEIHGYLTYNFSLSQGITVTTPTDFTITVNFEDHGWNTATKTVKIKVNP